MIEEVKKICPRCKGTGKITWHDKQIGKEFEGIDRESPCPDCQLFTKPDRPDRDKLRAILEYETAKCLKVGKDECVVESGSDACAKCQINQILALYYGGV